VNTQVRVQVTLADEHLVAHRAWVLAIVGAGVYLLMALAETLGDETAATDLAHVWLHTEVTILVIQQRLLCLEILTTLGARVWLQIRVHSLVYNEIALALESLAARRAVVVELTRVRGRVLRETDLAAKRLVACRTLKRFLARVLAHVLLQFVIRLVLLAAFRTHFRSPLPSHRRLFLLPFLIVIALLRHYV